ncbi:MAG: hypothetical protein WCJ58_03435 [bacterium]
MSRSLITVIDKSLIPAIIMVLSKFLGIILIGSLLQLPVHFLVLSPQLFNLSTITSSTGVVTLSTYSDMIMFTVIALGFLVVNIKAWYFHNSHLSIATIARLADLNLLHIIQSSFEIYHTGIVWFIFNWLSICVILFNVLSGKTEIWLLLVALFFSICLTIILFKDLINEVDLAKKKLLYSKI